MNCLFMEDSQFSEEKENEEEVDFLNQGFFSKTIIPNDYRFQAFKDNAIYFLNNYKNK